MAIVFHIPTEYERFQTQIGRWSLEDVSSTMQSNRTRELYGSTEGTVKLIIPRP